MKHRFATFITSHQIVALIALAIFSSCHVAGASEPLIYTVKFPAPETHYAEVEMTLPTSEQATIELMMPIWSPGFYRVEDYASKVEGLAAKNADGVVLEVTQPRGNRWLIASKGAAKVTVTYRLLCDRNFVTANWVSEDLLVLNGAAAFPTLVEKEKRPHEVRLALAPKWKLAASGLEIAADGDSNHFVAPDYDTLVDSPIVAGNLTIREFTVAESKHQVVDAGEYRAWDGQRGAEAIKKIVRESNEYWGELPFRRYVFLNVFRRGGGGLEHSNSTLLTSSPNMTAPNVGWLSFVAHEYVHAFNVKRLRPIELSQLDYERPPITSSLWISEGLTTYGADLIVARAGLCDTKGFLSLLSGHISSLQNTPGRLKKTLDQASRDVWTSGMSGVARDRDSMVSYYVKGPVVGFVLDAKIQRATEGQKSLDDVMRLAYKRYGGATGFTPDQFRQTAEEVAEIDLKPSFQSWLASTDEIDYSEALDWFGLRFEGGDEPSKAWQLSEAKESTEAQKKRLKEWLDR